jgi:hypothetical protein
MVRDGWVWAGAAVVAASALGWLTWHAYAGDDEDTSWTTPVQPPAAAALAVGARPGRQARDVQARKAYPGSLTTWGESVVGCC